MLAVTALLVTGVAGAEKNASYADPDAKPTRPASKEGLPSPQWKMALQPAEMRALAGEPASFQIKLASRAPIDVKLAIVKVSEGATATLSEDHVKLSPGNTSSVRLVVTPADATRGPIVVVVEGISPSGEKHDARAALHAKEKPIAKPTPFAHKRLDKIEDRTAEVQRLDELESRLLDLRAQIDAYLKVLREMRKEHRPAALDPSPRTS